MWGDFGDKGLVMYYLLWNLPRRAFEEIVEEVAGLTGVKNIDVELLWNLIGSNLRELGQPVINYNGMLGSGLARESLGELLLIFRGGA